MKVGWWQFVSLNDGEGANYKVTDLLASITEEGKAFATESQMFPHHREDPLT